VWIFCAEFFYIQIKKDFVVSFMYVKRKFHQVSYLRSVWIFCAGFSYIQIKKDLVFSCMDVNQQVLSTFIGLMCILIV